MRSRIDRSKVGVYCICMPERRHACETLFDTLGIDVDYTPLMLKVDVGQVRSSMAVSSSLTDGEVACYISHLNAYRAFLSTSQHIAIIFEDDNMMTGHYSHDRMGTIIEWALSQRDAFDVINISPCLSWNTGHVVCRIDKQTRVQRGYATCANAYIMSRRSANRMISMPSIHKPLDIQVQALEHTYEVHPRLFKQNPRTPSIVGNSPGMFTPWHTRTEYVYGCLFIHVMHVLFICAVVMASLLVGRYMYYM